jgi:hypothetical protein
MALTQHDQREASMTDKPRTKDQILKDVRRKIEDNRIARQVRTYNEAGEMIKDWHDDKR